jgi:hypothetical protein
MGCVQSTRADATHSPRAGRAVLNRMLRDCVQTTSTTHQPPSCAGHTSTCNSVLHKSVPDTDDAGRRVRSTRQLVLPPEQVLGLCRDTCSQFFPGTTCGSPPFSMCNAIHVPGHHAGQDHITLAAIALVESSGDAEKLAERASIADITCGLCQVRPQLASMQQTRQTASSPLVKCTTQQFSTCTSFSWCRHTPSIVATASTDIMATPEAPPARIALALEGVAGLEIHRMLKHVGARCSRAIICSGCRAPYH